MSLCDRLSLATSLVVVLICPPRTLAFVGVGAPLLHHATTTVAHNSERHRGVQGVRALASGEGRRARHGTLHMATMDEEEAIAAAARSKV